MTNGNLQIAEAPYYEDYPSLKKWIRRQRSKYGLLRFSRFMFNQAGSAGYVEVSEKSGETIADIGKAAETWVAQISAWAENVIVTLTWTDTDGTSGSSTITLVNANETAFTVPITTGYMATACSIDVVNPAGVTVKVGVTGMATPVATIQAAATVALEADLSGVGRINMAQKTDQVATDGGKDGKLDYVDPWGNIKYGLATMDPADTSTEVVWYEASSAYVATTVLVKDYYRTRYFESEIVAADEWLLIAPGGAAVYAVIAPAYHISMHSRYTAPKGRTAWLGRIVVTMSVATNIETKMKISFVPFGHTETHNIVISIADYLPVDPVFKLAENTEIKFEIIGNLTNNTFNLHILEAVNL